MTITVLGHLSVDEVHFPQKAENVRPPGVDFGGIYFSLIALASLVGPTDVVHPVFGVGEKEFDDFKKRLEDFPTIDTSGIFKFKGNTNRVLQFIGKEGENRIECSKNISDPIPFNKIKPYLDADGILINMVSGFDITLETLDSIRMTVRDSRTPIHFDFHSLTLGIDQENKRFRRPLTDWRRWCFMLNSIQMSEEEALGLTAEKYDEPTLVNQLMPLMVEALVITKGERGATAILQNNKKLTRQDISGSPWGSSIDSMGCGDVFGAAFFYRRLQQKSYIDSAEFANRIAGMKAAVEDIAKLPAMIGKIKTGSIVQ